MQQLLGSRLSLPVQVLCVGYLPYEEPEGPFAQLSHGKQQARGTCSLAWREEMQLPAPGLTWSIPSQLMARTMGSDMARGSSPRPEAAGMQPKEGNNVLTAQRVMRKKHLQEMIRSDHCEAGSPVSQAVATCLFHKPFSKGRELLETHFEVRHLAEGVEQGACV